MLRNGTRNFFLFVEPQAGWRQIHGTEHCTKCDFAHEMQWLVEEHYPEADVIRVVLDNFNTHTTALLYDAFGRPKHVVWRKSWSSTTRPSTAAGSTWRRLH